MRNGWEAVLLGRIAIQSRERVRLELGRAYRTVGVLRDGQGLFDREPFVGGRTSYRELTPVQAGQLILRSITAWEAPIGVATQAQSGAHVSGVFPAFDLDQRRVLPDYMALVCQHPPFWEEMRVRTTGTVLRRKTLSALGLLSIPIDLPPLAEQRRIVDVIGAVNELIAAAEATAHAYTRVRQELVSWEWHEMRSHEAPVSNLVGTVFGSGFKDGDWIESKDQSPRTDGAIRLLQLADVGVGEFLDRSDRWITRDTFRRLRCTAVLPGDLLVSRMADPAGRTARVPPRDYGMVTAVDCTVVRLDPTVADSDYWLAMLNSRHWLSAVDRLSTGSTRRRITRRNLERIQVPVVPLARQKKVGALVAAVAEAAASANKVVRVLTALRGALLANLLSGEHEIPDSYDRFLSGAA